MKNYQALYFAKNFKTYSELIQSYSLGGGNIPSRFAFETAKKQLRHTLRKIKKSATRTE